MTNIHTLDTHFQDTPLTIANYILESSDGLVLIETGPGSIVKNLPQAFAEAGLGMEDVRHVFVTHIHLDHAGAAGWWAQKGARVYVHHIGAPHLLDPSRLMASATRIYGEAMDRLWGDMLPVPAEQLTELFDGDVVQIGDLMVRALDTPGHARHHMTFVVDGVAFTGDVAGVHVPGTVLIDLPAPPPEFDWEAWQKSLNRLRQEALSALYLTHFGRVDEDVEGYLDRFEQVIVSGMNFVRDCLVADMDRDEIVASYLRRDRQLALDAGLSMEAIAQYEVANPPTMSVDGMIRYWRKKWEREGKS
ncbi:MAG: MBL fold metallo-hydrolase [Anaerolineales bacterium]|nr:MBL fold metallo-hydrolase [Anaerolineales bacterium]